MTDFAFARSQMAMSLAFHIVFAAIGIGMPLLMAIAEGLHLRSREAIYLDLAQRWARGTAILFAVGAVSGTVLSFELGLLWPRFMEYAGGIIGMPFSLEGFAFFSEAIFLGIYLYGWDRIPAVVHWLAGIVVAMSGMLSGVFVVGQRLDECADRVRNGRRPGHEDRPDRRHAQPRRPAAGHPHGAGRLRRDRFRGRRRPRLLPAARSNERVPPDGVRHLAGRGRDRHPASDGQRRHDRPDGRAPAAGEVRGDGSSLPDGSGRADYHRRDPGRCRHDDPLWSA